MEDPKNAVSATGTDVGGHNTKEAQVEQGHATMGADEALAFTHEGLNITAEANRAILRKIDWHVMPWLCSLYFLQYLDKTILSYSAVMGIETDTNLTSGQYSWCGSIYYLGYLAGEYPHNRMLQRFNQTKYLAVCASFWAITLCTMAACQNFAGLMVVRAIMGTMEGAVSAGFILITSKWYKKYEHAKRVSWWAAANGMALCIGGVVAYGCYEGSLNAHLAIAGWRILALVTGLVTLVFAFCMFFFMADSVVSARWLSQDEKVVAVERLRENHQGVGTRRFKWYQFREAFLDPRTWLYVLFILTTQIPLAGTTLFSTLLIKSLDFSSGDSLLLSLGGGGIQILTLPMFGYIADRYGYRSLTAASSHLISIFAIGLQIGLARVGLLHDRGGQLFAYFLISGNGATSFFLCLSMISSNTLGYTKKTTVNAIAFVTMAVSYLAGPQIFVNPPYYTSAKDATLALWSVAFIIMMGIWYFNRWENNKRDKLEAEGQVDEFENQAFLDLTDRENKKFRYVL